MFNRSPVSWLVVLGCLFSPMSALGDVERQVIVFFAPNAVTLPQVQRSVQLQEAQIPDASLESIMSQWNVEELKLGFPDFANGDTSRVSRTGQIVQIPDYSHVLVLTVAQSADAESLVVYLNARSDVLWAHRDSVEPLDQCPVDPPVACPPIASPNDEFFRSNFNDSWHLYNCVTPGGDVNAAGAWLITTGSDDVTIGIVDSGVDLLHEDFVGKSSGDSETDADHGTEVASVASANTDNGCGVASLNWHARINAQYTTSESSSRNSGVLDAINAGVDIINMSFGSYSYNETRHSLLATAYKLDMILCASVGNDGVSTPHFPSSHYEALSVAATTNQDQRATWSNYGKVDVAAPGEEVVVARRNNTYGFNDGTSFASPMVASLAGLLLAEDPSLCVEDVMGIIRSSARDINAQTNPGPDQYIGAGRIDARAALDRLSAPWTLDHLTATGATTTQEVGDLYLHKFFDTPGLANNIYQVQRIEYTRIVNFGALYATPPQVWGLKSTDGFYPTFNVTFGVGWAEPVPGTLTKTGGVLRTYAYDVWTIEGTYVGRFPSAQNVAFDYSVLGLKDLLPPAPTVNAPNGGQSLQVGGQMTVTWVVADEYWPGVQCTIALQKYNQSGGLTNTWVLAQNQPVAPIGGLGFVTLTIPGFVTPGPRFKVRVTAYDSNNHQGSDLSNAYFSVSGEGGGHEDPPPPCEYPCQVYAPTPTYVTDFLPVSPNPFNTGTRVRFTLEQADEVALHVYDVQGRLVRRIAEGFRERGAHEIQWDGSDDTGRSLSSGVYFAALNASGRLITQKLVIMR